MTFDPQRKRGGNQREFVPSESLFCSGYVLSSVTGQVLARPRCHRGTGRETDRVSERGEERRGLHVPRRSGERFILSLSLHIVRRLQPPRADNAGNFRLELVVFHLFC